MTPAHAAVIEFLRGTLNIAVTSPDEDLIGRGLLDSLGIVELLFFLEQRFGVQVDLATLELDQLSSVNAICLLVQGGDNAAVGGTQ